MIRIYKYGEVPNDEIFARVTPTVDVGAIVTDIIANVRARGDAAIFEYCEKFDRAKLERLAVTPAEIDAAVASVDPEFLRILREAAENIRAFICGERRNRID